MEKIAYILDEFPKLSETFIAREILGLKNAKIDLQIISMKYGIEKFIPNEIKDIVKATIYLPHLLSINVLLVHLCFFLKNPIKYLYIYFYLLIRSHRNFRVFIRTIYHFGIGVYLSKIVKAKGIKHIHAHLASGPTTVALVISKILNIPFSFTAHAVDIYADAIMLKEKLKQAKFIVTCTEFNKRYLLSLYNCKEKIHMIYHGIPMEGNGRQTLNIYIQGLTIEPLILSVGRLVEKKGFPYLIEAAKILKGRGYKFKCIIVGDGTEYNKLNKLVKNYNLDKIVILTGALPFDEIMKLYKKASIFVLPCIIASNNDRDGIPNTILEAMAFGIPVISTEISGIPEVIEDMKTGLLIKEKDPDALAEAIERLIKDETLRDKLGKNGRAKVIERFDIEKNTKELIDLFREKI